MSCVSWQRPEVSQIREATYLGGSDNPLQHVVDLCACGSVLSVGGIVPVCVCVWLAYLGMSGRSLVPGRLVWVH